MNSEKIHVMVDIETGDTDRTAVIFSIGACLITPIHGIRAFYVECAKNQFERTTSIDTLKWWGEQPDGLMPVGETPLDECLDEFSQWLKALPGEPIIWCKGMDFDTAILAHAYRQFKMEVPWKYNAVRDFRTVKKLFPLAESPANPKPHNALHDALAQASELDMICRVYDFVLK